MIKKAVQQGRSEQRSESYLVSYGEPLNRRENDAGGLFQHPNQCSPVIGFLEHTS